MKKNQFDLSVKSFLMASMALFLSLGLWSCEDSASSSTYSSTTNTVNPFETDPELREIDRILNNYSERYDPPELKRLTKLCRQGDMRACNEEIAMRNRITRNLERGIQQQNQIHNQDWVNSFGR